MSGEFVVSKSMYNNLFESEVLVNLWSPFLPHGNTITSPLFTLSLESIVSMIPSPSII